MRHYLYILKFPSGKEYVGLTHDVPKRCRRHQDLARQGSMKAVHCAIRKYGWGSVQVWLAASGSLEEVAALEVKTIATRNTLSPNGYNLAVGGELSPMTGKRHSKEIKAQISKTISIQTRSPERRELSRQLGLVNFKGKHHTEETRAKMCKAWEHRIISEETRRRMSLAHLGKPLSEAHRKAISEG